MDGPARAGRDRAAITGSAGPAAGKGAVPPRSSRGSGQPVSPTGAEAVYRQLFDSFDRDRDDSVSQWAVLSRLQGCGPLLPDDPRIQEALAGLTATEGASKQISFGQFKALPKHNNSLIQREGNLAVPDFPALSSDIERMYGELLPVRSGSVADHIPQLRRVDQDPLAIAVCTVDGQRFSAGDARTACCLQSVSKTVSYCPALDEHSTEGNGHTQVAELLRHAVRDTPEAVAV